MIGEYNIPSTREIRELSEKENLFSVISTFAGGGGSSTGYRMAGGKVHAVNEFVEEAQITYAKNWPDTPVLGNDIRELSPEELLSAAKLNVGELDIFDGSPPCSAFSTSGKGHKGWGDAQKKYSDKSQANIEDLFFEYIRLLRGIKPRMFVAENVAGLTVGKSKGYLNQILRELEDSDYHVEARLVDAKWLSIPQLRKRLIIVGVRRDVFRDRMAGRLHPKPHSRMISLEEAFHGLRLTEEDKRTTDISKYATYKLLRETARGKAHPRRFNLKKCHPKKPAFCIIAATANPSAAAPRHWDNRMFSVAETKRIMSVPDDYELTGTQEQQIERLGRMVPPLMMKAIAENLNRVVLRRGSTL